MLLPGGLGSLLYKARDSWLRVVARRHELVVPSLIADTGTPALLGGDARPAVAAVLPGTDDRNGPRFLKRLSSSNIPDVDYFTYPDLNLSGGDPNLLSLRSIDVAYGQVQVLFGVSLELRRGETIALLGTNGAGKSTVLRAISGLIAPTNGSISHEGVDISGMAPHMIAAKGIIQVPGGRGVFPSLTVGENLRDRALDAPPRSRVREDQYRRGPRDLPGACPAASTTRRRSSPVVSSRCSRSRWRSSPSRTCS